MNRKKVILIFGLFLFLGACSSNDKEESLPKSQEEKAESKMDSSLSGEQASDKKAEKRRQQMIGWSSTKHSFS